MYADTNTPGRKKNLIVQERKGPTAGVMSLSSRREREPVPVEELAPAELG